MKPVLNQAKPLPSLEAPRAQRVAAEAAGPAVGMGRESLALSRQAQGPKAEALQPWLSPRLKRELARYAPEVLNFAGKGAMFWGGMGLLYGAAEAVAMSQPLALVAFGVAGAVGGGIAHLAFGAFGSAMEISAVLKQPEGDF